MLTTLLYFAAASVAFFTGLCAGAASERQRATKIAERAVLLSNDPQHEFWKGYAAAADSIRVQIKGGAL